ncbi:MAG: hypothetical protein C0614_09505 [Desulfuromonas sp.]|nr:MAG: hypothetical protein C0614_09505 [Desulfuromonas sp.]
MRALMPLRWFIAFSVALVLAACASGPTMSGKSLLPDSDIVTPGQVTQTEDLEQRQNQLNINQAWLAELNKQLTEREKAVSRRENELTINEAWIAELNKQLTEREETVDRHENELAINQAWLDEREARLATTLTAETGECFANVFIPAQYRTVAVTKPVDVPPGDNFPVRYQSVKERVKISDDRYENMEVLCQNEMTDCRVKEIQRSLFKGGYYSGPIDGIIGKQTRLALNNFQKDFNLAVTNHLTVETIRSLDTNF